MYEESEVLTANKEGRVVILPYKVGDTVYGFGPKYGFKCTAPLCINGGQGCHLMGGCYSRKFVVKEYKFNISMCQDWGITIFPTRFLAERAMNELGDYNKYYGYGIEERGM